MASITWVSSLSRNTAARVEAFERSRILGPVLWSVIRALLVGISYYVGTRIGFTWTPHGQPNSTFWPPNAILLAALLLAPRKAWWTFLLAVLPAHMLAQLQTGVPISTAMGWFVTNITEALIGAYCITRFTDSQKKRDSVRWVFVFVVFGVFFAPLATSFLDAAVVVITSGGAHYWPLGLERFWTNALAELTIVPAVVFCRSQGISSIPRISVARWGEAAFLAVGIVVVAVLIFGLQVVSPETTPALLYVPLPFLLWVAARFGLGGVSLSVLCLALISTWYTMHGREPFPYASMTQNILSLQIFLCMTAVLLMFLSAVMGEARCAQESLRRMSGSLIHAQEEERYRIARELHDDLGQELALVKVTLDGLIEMSGEVFKPALTDLSARLSLISDTTREISHGLYPTQLEYLGLAKAVKRLCDEVRRGQDLSIHLKVSNLPDQLGPTTSLSLYRVTQEALHNIIKHSRASNVQVQLGLEKDHLLLQIIDDGVGFNLNQDVAGLGLASMRHRILAIGGSIDISSLPAAGTRIEVRLPVRHDRSDDRDAA